MEGKGYLETMGKFRIVALIVLVLLSGPLFARDFFDMNLGLSGVYQGNPTLAATDFFGGMGTKENWLVGVELGMRASFLDLVALAVPNDGPSNGLMLHTSGGFSIPVITDFAYLGVGAGITTDFEFPESGESKVNGRFVSDTDFIETVNDSPIHFRAALDFLLGNASIGLSYYWESQATLLGLQTQGGWATLFQPGERANLAVVLRLTVF